MKHVPALTAWLLLGALASAAQPKSVITGVLQETAPGMITLSSAGSVSDVIKPTWVFCPSSIKKIVDIDGSLNLIKFDNAPVNGEAILITAGKLDDGSVVTDTMTVQFSFGTNPPTPPGPGPTPVPPTPVPPLPPVPPTPPAPNLPPGRFNLATISYNAALAVPTASRSKSGAVADCFTATVNAIVGGSITDLPTACKQTSAAVETALGTTDAPAWDAPFTSETNKASVYQQINALITTGKINTVGDIADAFKEVALGTGQAK